jgi:glycosyltransferase involved in cell wall biosynthesis
MSVKNLDYSVVIRTLGLAGEKYQRMLEAIDKQTIKPREIIVVLAEGYALPPEQLGYERFVYSKKGIVTQRSVGALEAKGDYCLFLDDDMLFEPDMVEQLFKPIQAGIAEVSFPLLTEMLPHGIGKYASMLCATAVPMICGTKDNYVKILRTGGWTYNSHVDESVVRYYKAQSAPGGIYLALREAAVKIRFQEEDWLQLTSFSLPDDQINFYKYHVLGYRIVGVSGQKLWHLDGGGNSHDRQLKATYALAKHRTIFWHRFIYKIDKNPFSKMWSVLCFSYEVVTTTILSVLINLLHWDWAMWKQSVKGLRDGFKFLNTEHYKGLPLVLKENYK